jgi:hypothetical protein
MSHLPPFLADGIRFACTNCGACCTGAPGWIQVSREEILAIAGHLGEDPRALAARAVRREGDRLSLREADNGDCVFFKEQRCQIHPVKPAQCRLYPFWFRNVRNEEAWERTRNDCPGIGEGETVPPGEILRQVQADLDRLSHPPEPLADLFPD